VTAIPAVIEKSYRFAVFVLEISHRSAKLTVSPAWPDKVSFRSNFERQAERQFDRIRGVFPFERSGREAAHGVAEAPPTAARPARRSREATILAMQRFRTISHAVPERAGGSLRSSHFSLVYTTDCFRALREHSLSRRISRRRAASSADRTAGRVANPSPESMQEACDRYISGPSKKSEDGVRVGNVRVNFFCRLTTEG